MPSPNDPTRIWRRRERWTLALAGCVVTLTACWAFAPLGPPPAVSAELRTPATGDEPSHAPAPVDRAAFAAKLWNPVPPPPAAAAVDPPKPAAPPPTLQLIGIVHDASDGGEHALRAALYDPNSDTLHIVVAGEQIGRVRVAAIEPDSVRLDIAGRPATLALRDDTRPGRRP